MTIIIQMYFSPWTLRRPCFSGCTGRKHWKKQDDTKNPIINLVGGFSPFEQNSQLGRLFQIYGAMKNVPNHQSVIIIVNNSPKLVHRLGEFPQQPHHASCTSGSPAFLPPVDAGVPGGLTGTQKECHRNLEETSEFPVNYGLVGGFNPSPKY